MPKTSEGRGEITISDASIQEKKKKKKRKKGSNGSYYFWDGWAHNASDDGVVIVLVILALLGVVFLVYAIALAFTYILSQGESRRARRYWKRVEKFELNESEGATLGKKLDRTKLYFSYVFFVFAAEEVTRFLLHTGPADLPVWIFRLICLGFFTAVTGVFLVRLHRWRSFKSTQKYQQTTRQIAKLENMSKNLK